MRLTKQTGHAIRILIECAQAGDRLNKIADIADRLDITRQNVFKIAHILSRAGFISAVRGPNGGVRLARAPTEIRIGEIVRAIEVTSVEISGDRQPDDADDAPPSGMITGVFGEALGAFIAVLDQHTLADLASSAKPSAAGAQPKKPSRRATAAARREPAISEDPFSTTRRRRA